MVDSINIVYFNDRQNTQAVFHECRTVPFGNLKERYSQWVGVPAHLMEFRFNGRRIKDHQTLEMLGVENDDVIAVSRKKNNGNDNGNVSSTSGYYGSG